MPFKLPYDITVKTSTIFAETQSKTINLRSQLSTSPITFSLPLVPAEGTPASNINLSGDGSPEFTSELRTAKGGITHHLDGRVTLDVTIPPFVNGGQYKLGWELTTPNISPSSRTLAVNLTVDPNADLPYAFGKYDSQDGITPISLLEMTKQISSTTYISGSGELLISAGAGEMILESYSFVDAAGNPAPNPPNYEPSMLQVLNWKPSGDYAKIGGWGWITSIYFPACDTGRTICVPPGTYYLRLAYRFQLGSDSQNVNFPVKITVVP